MNRLSTWAVNYLDRTRQYPAPRFLFEMLALSFALTFAVGALFGIFGVEIEPKTTDAIAEMGPLAAFIGAIIAAPLVETAIGQWLPIAVISRYTTNLSWIMVGSALFFAAQHLHVGWMGPVSVLPTAVILSWCWWSQRQRSIWRAYCMTTALHALHNAVALAVYYIFPHAA